MVALAPALIPKPKLLRLGELSLGLAPGLVKNGFRKLVETSAETGMALLIGEHKVRGLTCMD